MRHAMIAVLALASISLQASEPVVQPIGFHRYMIIDAGPQVFAKANETCANPGLGRYRVCHCDIS
jgi:hypothetical protein